MQLGLGLGLAGEARGVGKILNTGVGGVFFGDKKIF
jgi:hypothetical protein